MSDTNDIDEDDVQGHGLQANVNETTEDDDDVEGHALTLNVNETAEDGD